MMRLPPDPLDERVRELFRSVTRLQRIIADAFKQIENSGGIGDPFTFAALTKAQTECRETLMEIEKIRLAKAKQRRDDRLAAKKLPPADDRVINAEIDRRIAERLSQLSALELRQLYEDRQREERMLDEPLHDPEPPALRVLPSDS